MRRHFAVVDLVSFAGIIAISYVLLTVGPLP